MKFILNFSIFRTILGNSLLKLSISIMLPGANIDFVFLLYYIFNSSNTHRVSCLLFWPRLNFWGFRYTTHRANSLPFVSYGQDTFTFCCPLGIVHIKNNVKDLCQVKSYKVYNTKCKRFYGHPTLSC